MNIQKFDRLNNYQSSKATSSMRSLSYEDYFLPMRLSKKQKEERIEMARKFEDKILFVLSMIAVFSQYNMLDGQDIRSMFKNAYMDVLGSDYEISPRLNDYIGNMSNNLADATQKNIDDEYYTSYDRARLISENEANTILNYEDDEIALLSGKTHKTWLTMGDSKVRKSHRKMDGKTIPINDYFVVGDTILKYPCDFDSDTSDGKETINCRCSIEYT